MCHSPHFVASVEQGRRLPPGDFVERAEDALEAFGVPRAAARYIARQPGLAAWFRLWAQLDATAVSLCTYECRVVPGLLQTEAYARAVMLNVPPPPTEEEVAQRIAARLERQKLLTREPPIALPRESIRPPCRGPVPYSVARKRTPSTVSMLFLANVRSCRPRAGAHGRRPAGVRGSRAGVLRRTVRR